MNASAWTEVRRTVRQDRLDLVEYGVDGWEAWDRVKNAALSLLTDAELDWAAYEAYKAAVREERQRLAARVASGAPDW